MNKASPLIKIGAVVFSVFLAAAFIRDRAGGYELTKAFIWNNPPATTPERVDPPSMPAADTAIFSNSKAYIPVDPPSAPPAHPTIFYGSKSGIIEQPTIISGSKYLMPSPTTP
jgi:hypothetical protein